MKYICECLYLFGKFYFAAPNPLKGAVNFVKSIWFVLFELMFLNCIKRTMINNSQNIPDMFYGASPEIMKRAEYLRKNMTLFEKRVWFRLRSNQLGVRFRAQHPIDIFIVDFYCHAFKLVVEIDGEIHLSQKDYDQGRTAELKRLGLKVIRFSNKEVENDIGIVIDKIKGYLI